MNAPRHAFLLAAALATVLPIAVPTAAWGDELTIYYDYVENGRLTGGRIVVDAADEAQRARFRLDAPPGFRRLAWPVSTVIDNGPTANRIDIVMLGDGYTAAEMGLYATHVANVLADFFPEEPLAAYASYFNVHRVDVTSNQSGVDEPASGIFRDTALDMAYDCAGIDRLLCINVAKALAAAASAPDVDQILALANSARYGGAGYPGNDLGTLAGANGAAVEVALHEFGHAFADLADEYDYGGPTTYTGPEPIEANISIYTAAQQVAQFRKWYRWMDLANVDTFEGANYSELGIYRPTFDSKMRSLNRPFEQVNVEQFVISLYATVSPIDDATPPSGTPLPPDTLFSVTPLQPVDHALAVQWSVDAVPIAGATGTTFTPSAAVPNLSIGTHTVAVTVTDTTTRVRDETLRGSLMTDTRQWTIEVAATCGALTAPATAPFPHDRQKSRYLSFAPNNGTLPVAFKLTKVSGGATDVGWVAPPDASGISQVVPLTTPFAQVQRVWNEPVIHVGDCEVVPNAWYELRAACEELGPVTAPLTVGTVPQPFPKLWGDTVGQFGMETPGLWDSPNGVVNVNDFVAALEKFQNPATTRVHLTVVDVVGAGLPGLEPCLNRSANIADVFNLIKAFQGSVYPFTSDPATCPPCP